MYRFASHSVDAGSLNTAIATVARPVSDQLNDYFKKWRWGDEEELDEEKPRVNFLYENAYKYEAYLMRDRNSTRSKTLLVFFAVLEDTKAVEAKLRFGTKICDFEEFENMDMTFIGMSR